jgi:hypothetical protein
VEWEFAPNAYDSCVVNKMVNGKQHTIAWHVNDLKISHVDTKVVDSLIDDLDHEFGKETPLSKSRGKIHDYLGMTLDFSINGQVMVTMINYIKMICMDLPKEMVGSATTPAASHLFRIDNENAAPPPPPGQGTFRFVCAPDNATALSQPKSPTRHSYCNVFSIRMHPIPECS